MSELTKALAAFQAELPHIIKGNTAEVPTRTGGKYSYAYADLTDVSNDILPKLAKHGLAWSSSPGYTKRGFALRYELRHTSGESIVGYYPLPQAAPQEIGSAITYARRYALCAVTGVAPGGDDDDAQKAQAGVVNRPEPAPPRVTKARIESAKAAILGAATVERLDEVWDAIGSQNMAQMAELVTAHDQKRAEFAAAGHTSDVDAAWAVKEVPS